MNNLKVLVVDDERIIREGISKSINWEELGLDLSGTCEDAYDALDIFRHSPPDIAIVDIQMPGMSGLELIEQVCREKIPIQFIILSGFGEFEYAQKAISLGVKQYLLKPLDRNKLKQSLIEIKADLIKDSSGNRWELHQTIRKALSGSEEFKPETLEILSGSGEDLFWLLTVNGEVGTEKPEQINRAIRWIHGLEWDGLTILLFNIDKTAGPEILLEYLSFLTDLFQLAQGEKILSSGIPGPASEICLQYRDCKKKILEYQLNTIIRTENTQALSRLAIQIQKLNRNSMDGNLENAKTDTESIFPILDFLEITMEQRKSLYFRILDIMNTSRQKLKTVESQSRNMELIQCSESAALNRTFQAIVVTAIEADRLDDSAAPMPWLVEKARQEIHKHFSDSSLTLRDFCSTVVFTNPDYLGKIFRQHVKKSFHTYLNTVRINAAKELIIQNPNLTMYEVARQTGFGENSQYFSKVFKGLEKISPSRFRDIIKQGILF